MAKLDHDWYEQAADVIANESSTSAERLAVLNELWSEYSFIANRKICGFTVSYERPDVLIRKMIDDALVTFAGYTLEQIIKYAKEKIANDTHEAQAAATDAE